MRSIFSFPNIEYFIAFFYVMMMPLSSLIGIIALLHIIILTFYKKGLWFFKGLFYAIILKSVSSFFHPPSSNLFLTYIILIDIYFLYNFFLYKKIYYNQLESKLFILLALFTLTSLFGSHFLDFSLIRIFVLSLIVFACFNSTLFIKKEESLNFINKATILLVLLSAILLPFPQGYLMPLPFFKGILNHSQEFATVLTPLLTIFIISLLNKKNKITFFNIIIVLLGLFELFSSASRSGVFALFIAIFIYSLLYYKNLIRTYKSIISTLILSFFTILLLIFFNDVITSKILSFINKYDSPSHQTSKTLDANKLLVTRSELLETSIDNFINNPFLGIGFNVQTKYPDPIMNLTWKQYVKYIPGTDIMYSRPLEKGNLYTSVFEEGGVFVGFYFLYIWIWLFIKLYKSGEPILWVSYLTIILNMAGEASFFSVMGIGNMQVLLFAWLFHYSRTSKERQ